MNSQLHYGTGLNLLLAVFSALLVSCGGGTEDSADRDRSNSLRRTYERGPVEVTVEFAPRELSIADRAQLTIEGVAQEDYRIELPRFGDKLEQFGIVDFRDPPPELIEGNRTRKLRSYTLEPFLSGDYIIPPMTIRFWKSGEENDPHELETEEMTVQIRSLLPEQVGELQIHDIEPPVTLPRPSRGPWIAGILGALAIMGVLVWLFFRRRRHHAEVAAARRPAHEIAYDELRCLVAEGLAESGEVKKFYQRLSSILRHYIENRFAIHAPEQTTEEFLVSLGSDHRLASEQKRALKVFLNHCDLVKFAEHQPTTTDIQNTFDSCKQFIRETEEAGTTDSTQVKPTAVPAH